jgi:hypothetical protein
VLRSRCCNEKSDDTLRRMTGTELLLGGVPSCEELEDVELLCEDEAESLEVPHESVEYFRGMPAGSSSLALLWSPPLPPLPLELHIGDDSPPLEYASDSIGIGGGRHSAASPEQTF